MPNHWDPVAAITPWYDAKPLFVERDPEWDKLFTFYLEPAIRQMQRRGDDRWTQQFADSCPQHFTLNPQRLADEPV